LKEIHEKKITFRGAYRLIRKIAISPRIDDLGKLIGLSEIEAHAALAGYGADLPTLLRWRYRGWPSDCYHCGRRLDLKKLDTWEVVSPYERRGGRPLAIDHVECPDVVRERRK
jgi:hypothetical protein